MVNFNWVCIIGNFLHVYISILIVKSGIFTFFEAGPLRNPIIIEILHIFDHWVDHFDGRKRLIHRILGCFPCLLGRFHGHNTSVPFVTLCSRFRHRSLRHHWPVCAYHWCSKRIHFALRLKVLHLLYQVGELLLILFGSLFLFFDFIITFLYMFVDFHHFLEEAIGFATLSLRVHLSLPGFSIGSHLSCSLPIELHPIDVHPINIVFWDFSVEVGVLITLGLHLWFHHYWSMRAILRIINIGQNTCVN